MTNLERWRFYLKDIISPDSFIDISFYFMIGASLQRRVWLGPEQVPNFPNMYIILVADPGVGKGLVLKPVIDFLRFHKRSPKIIDFTKGLEGLNINWEEFESVKETLEAISKARYTKSRRENLLIPVGSDSTTYESLIKRHSESESFMLAPKTDVINPTGKYLHHSITFALEEVSTLFRRKAEDVVRYLIKSYDCGHFEYETVSRGLDAIRNPCLSLLAGTQPSFLCEAFSDKLLNEGFASRTIFVFEGRPRFWRFGIPMFNKQQMECRLKILEHIKKLSTLFGQVTLTEEAFEFLRKYFEEKLPFQRKNASRKLDSYYARKAQNAQKLIMAMHFSESTEMIIGIKPCIKTLDFLEKIENKMHLALSMEGDTEFAKLATKVLRFLRDLDEPKNFKDIWIEFPVKDTELLDVIRYLSSTGKINSSEINNITYWEIATKAEEKYIGNRYE